MGNRLPGSHGPWTVTGVIGPDKAPPHNLSREAIEAAIEAEGYQLWRMARRPKPGLDRPDRRRPRARFARRATAAVNSSRRADFGKFLARLDSLRTPGTGALGIKASLTAPRCRSYKEGAKFRSALLSSRFWVALKSPKTRIDCIAHGARSFS